MDALGFHVMIVHIRVYLDWCCVGGGGALLEDIPTIILAHRTALPTVDSLESWVDHFRA